MQQLKRTNNNIAKLIAKVKCSDDEVLKNILKSYEEAELIDDFQNFVSNQPEQTTSHIKCFKDKLLNKLVPDIHRGYVLSIIKNQFKNDEQAYINTVPLFFKLFSETDRRICDGIITSSDKRERRKLNRRKKHLIIYSMQLLKLIGLNRSKIITNDCLGYYKNEMAKTDEFLEQFRLISADGKITKLTSNEVKQKQRLAQILNISNCLDLMAKDRGFTFSLITLTLPPAFHSAPMNGTSPFQGYTPQQALEQINSFWQSIRSHLAKLGLKFGRDLFGIQVLELQKSSTLHLHCLMYSSERNLSNIFNVVQKVKNIHNGRYEIENKKGNLTAEQVQFNKLHHIKSFDVKFNDGRKDNSGAKYVFKYITKTHSSYMDDQPDDSAVKNMACRYFYGCRGFNFFGIKGSISKFNFVLKHYLSFKDQLPKEIVSSLKSASYYDFVTKYERYFHNEHFIDGKAKRLLGVAFNKSAYECKQEGKIKTILNNEYVLLEKRQYCVFEKCYEKEYKNIDDLDDELDYDKLEYANIKRSYLKALDKQDLHEQAKKDFIELHTATLLGEEKLTTYLDIFSGKAKMKSNKSLLSSTKLHLFKTIQENPVLADFWLREDEYDMQEVMLE
jgi:hypothetical protein